MYHIENQQCLPLNEKPSLDSFSEIIDLYYSRRDSSLMPSRQDFDFKDFRGWHAQTCLSELVGDEVRIRIFGSALAMIFGEDFTGNFISESLKTLDKDKVRQFFLTLAEGPFIGHTVAAVTLLGREPVKVEVLDLPLQDGSGKVSNFIHVFSGDLEFFQQNRTSFG